MSLLQHGEGHLRPTEYQSTPFAQVLATLRAELFRSLLLQKIEFFDVHSASQLTNLISTELDSVRSFVFRNVSRDRGPRAILEASIELPSLLPIT